MGVDPELKFVTYCHTVSILKFSEKGIQPFKLFINLIVIVFFCCFPEMLLSLGEYLIFLK